MPRTWAFHQHHVSVLQGGAGRLRSVGTLKQRTPPVPRRVSQAGLRAGRQGKEDDHANLSPPRPLHVSLLLTERHKDSWGNPAVCNPRLSEFLREFSVFLTFANEITTVEEALKETA